MAGEEPSLKVVRTEKAFNDLKEIWRWNTQFYSLEHADQYYQFLTEQILELGKSNRRGCVVDGFPNLRYWRIARKPRKHGHVIVYQVTDDAVYILHVFHSAQDWQSKLGHET